MNISELTTQQKIDLCESLAQQITDDIDYDALLDYFYNSQLDFLSSLTDTELQEQFDNINNLIG